MVSFKIISGFTLASMAMAAPATTTFGTDDNWSTYPEVPKTASINGFADPIYTYLPECAKSCVAEDTDSTPCPYWDTGCLCVMANWGGEVADCVASGCEGNNVAVMTNLAVSACSAAGVPSPYWFIPASASSALVQAQATD